MILEVVDALQDISSIVSILPTTTQWHGTRYLMILQRSGCIEILSNPPNIGPVEVALELVVGLDPIGLVFQHIEHRVTKGRSKPNHSLSTTTTRDIRYWPFACLTAH